MGIMDIFKRKGMPHHQILLENLTNFSAIVDFWITKRLFLTGIPVRQEEHDAFCAAFVSFCYHVVLVGIRKQQPDVHQIDLYWQQCIEAIGACTGWTYDDCFDFLQDRKKYYDDFIDKSVDEQNYTPLADAFVFTLTLVEGLHEERKNLSRLLYDEGKVIIHRLNSAL